MAFGSGIHFLWTLFLVFQGGGTAREFCDVSGKNEILQKCQGILHFSLMKLESMVLIYFSC